MEPIYKLTPQQLEELLLEAIGEYQLLLLNGICDREARALAVQQVREALAQSTLKNTPGKQPQRQEPFRPQ
jgi:hypothetical protein